MLKAVTAAIVSIGLLGGTAGSAGAQAVEVLGLWWDVVNQVWRNSPPIGRPATPPPPPSGYWCVVGDPRAPISVRQMATPAALGTRCANPPYISVSGIVQ
jgi:hypothetical protein